MTFVRTSCSKQIRQFSPHNHHIRLCSIRWGDSCCFDHKKYARGGSSSSLSWFHSHIDLVFIGWLAKRRAIQLYRSDLYHVATAFSAS
jgi:hypothetical protein